MRSIKILKLWNIFPSTLRLEETQQLIQKIAHHYDEHGFTLYAVERKDTHEFIGFIGLFYAGFEAHFTPAVEIGWRLSSKHWGQGFAPEGAKAILDYAFSRLDIPEIVSFTAAGNQKSRRVMEKIGLQHHVSDDFDHPKLTDESPLRQHVLYRLDQKYYLAKINEEAINRYIDQHGFGITKLPLTRLLTADVFRQFYYDKQELIKFCRDIGISTTGLKNELNNRIALFLSTGQVNQVKFYKNKGKSDSEIGLSLNTIVVNYKSDPITRAFFQKHIPAFTGFSAYIQKWLKERLTNGECFTYAEVIEKHKAYLLEKHQIKARGELAVVAHDSCQYNQFYIDYAHDPALKIHLAKEAWELVRNSAGEKTYERYKEKIDEIRTLLNSHVV